MIFQSKLSTVISAIEDSADSLPKKALKYTAMKWPLCFATLGGQCSWKSCNHCILLYDFDAHGLEVP